jgi:SHS2 domain-containing protein
MSTFHTFQDHTGDVELTVGAPTLADLFREAARALAELMLGEPAGASARGAPQTVTVQARDKAALLVEWLNELIFRAETTKTVFDDVDVQHASDEEVVARLRGVLEPRIRTAVKAATLHGARLTETEKGFRAHVVLDV